MSDSNLFDTGLCNSKIKEFFDIRCRHRREQLPGNNVAGVIVQDAAQIIPAPTDDLEVGEIRLPQLVDTIGRMMKIGRQLP